MKPENITILDMVRFCNDLGFDVKMILKEKPKIRYNNWALYLRHKRSGKK